MKVTDEMRSRIIKSGNALSVDECDQRSRNQKKMHKALDRNCVKECSSSARIALIQGQWAGGAGSSASHMEIRNNHLYLYGNSLEALTNQSFQKTVTHISFIFIELSHISSFADSLKKFRKLLNLTFQHNRIKNFAQIFEIEKLMTNMDFNQKLELEMKQYDTPVQMFSNCKSSVRISDNAICKAAMFDAWMQFRFTKYFKVRSINGRCLEAREGAKTLEDFF